MTFSIEFHQKFHYQQNKRGGFIPVTLVAGEGQTTCGAKLDLGADCCYFSREHAEELGLQVTAGVPLRVETNHPDQPMIFYGHEIKIQALGYDIDSLVYFWEQYRLPRNLLGRAGWINRFRLGIIEHDSELYISHYDE